MRLEDAIKAVLSDAGEPLSAREVARRLAEQGLWTSRSRTPDATVRSFLATSAKRLGESSPFRRIGPAEYDLSADAARGTPTPPQTQERTAKRLTFLDAAEQVLWIHANREPMNYRQMTEVAISDGWLHSQGITPAATMAAQISTDIETRARRGAAPRFFRGTRGRVGLAAWRPAGLETDIQQQNDSARAELLIQVRRMPPTAFEQLVAHLLTNLGFLDVDVTRRSGDGGVDIRGRLLVGGVISTQMAVQVKRWAQNVQAPIVQAMRGSLGSHEQGLIVTTSDFGPGAKAEASRPNAVPISLMNGEQLVMLLVEHQIGIRRTPVDIFELEYDVGARKPTVALTGPFDPPVDPCSGGWNLHSAYGEWWCWSADFQQVLDRVINQPYRDMLKQAEMVTTRTECETRFPSLFWYSDKEAGPPGTCRGHE